jgi:hypothetical protein
MIEDQYSEQRIKLLLEKKLEKPITGKEVDQKVKDIEKEYNEKIKKLEQRIQKLETVVALLERENSRRKSEISQVTNAVRKK